VEHKSYKLEIDVVVDAVVPLKTLSFYFNSLKLLRQGSDRKEQQYFVMSERKYLLNDAGVYEPFVVFGKSEVSLSVMKKAVLRLELEEKEKGDFYALQKSNGIVKTWK
jgi:hypothetical protein